MKAPKRDYKQDVCPKCGSVVHWYSEEVDNGTGYETVDAYGECCNADCDFSVKGLRDHDGWEDHQQEARCTRKNREARLRNRIRVDLYHRMMEKYWKDCTMDCLDALTMREDMDGTFGQDVEGS